MNLSDVMKIVDELNYRYYHNDNPKKLNLKNQDRKFLTALLDRMFRGDRCDICTCYEKKQLWNGFLHHIHYRTKNEEAEIFVHAMRTKGNESVYSEFEKLMQENRCQQAAELLREKKGISAFSDKYVITGHTPTQAIRNNPNPGYIYRRNNHIAIDCGATYPGGRLAAICLDTGEEYYSEPNKMGSDAIGL